MKSLKALAAFGAVALAVAVTAHFSIGIAQEKAAEHAFVGAAKCKMCHSGEKNGSIYETWAASAHAKAFTNLPDAEKKNPTCLQCHTTGFGKPGGFDPATAAAGVDAVGCESCHGAAKDWMMVHAKDVAKAQTLGMNKVDQATCKTCHAGTVPEGHMALPAFDFAKAWPKIEHHKPAK
jgi:nitrate/TMAO reductase-like tetraheme cytochrome c subunit